jgi:hypothetical protein
VDAIGARLEFFKVSILELTNHERNSHESGGSFQLRADFNSPFVRASHSIGTAIGWHQHSPISTFRPRKANPRRGII